MTGGRSARESMKTRPGSVNIVCYVALCFLVIFSGHRSNILNALRAFWHCGLYHLYVNKKKPELKRVDYTRIGQIWIKSFTAVTNEKCRPTHTTQQ